MPQESDEEYHRARAEAEREATNKAASPQAREAHARLAEEHAERAGIFTMSPDQSATYSWSGAPSSHAGAPQRHT